MRFLHAVFIKKHIEFRKKQCVFINIFQRVFYMFQRSLTTL